MREDNILWMLPVKNAYTIDKKKPYLYTIIWTSEAGTLYVPTFSDSKAWNFYPGSARIFEDSNIDLKIFEDVLRLMKTNYVPNNLKNPGCVSMNMT